ncbi:Suppressor of IKBKE 1 [Ameca splendens]|uniref:Suppressor of IKBKE 1 n=1 Tax=Ameca splendens TaxID=208324 RepID=A0ABV0XIL5_9TELE
MLSGLVKRVWALVLVHTPYRLVATMHQIAVYQPSSTIKKKKRKKKRKSQDAEVTFHFVLIDEVDNKNSYFSVSISSLSSVHRQSNTIQLVSFQSMACTLEKVLCDARTLLERLKEHDTAAEGLIDQTGALGRRVQGMKEVGNALPDKHTEDSSEIQELTKYKPHVLLTQENTQIKELQQENKELWLSLEEHQYALELIMGRYRKQMLQLMMAKKELDTKPMLSLHQDHAKEVQSQVERICEMGQVMRRAVQVDEQHYCSVRERLAQLEIENKELRDLMAISKSSVKIVRDDTNQLSSPVAEWKHSPQAASDE